jgi:hypothetical protein
VELRYQRDTRSRSRPVQSTPLSKRARISSHAASRAAASPPLPLV